MQTVDTVKPQAMFVVVLREVLVAQDIEAILLEAAPGARVVLATTLDEAAAALAMGDGGARVAAAFVQLDPAEVGTSELGRRVAADGGRMVLLAQDPVGALPPGWSEMPFPFAEADVIAQVTGEAGRRLDDGEEAGELVGA